MTDHVALADQYAEDVVEGRILACQWVRLACRRYLNDRAQDGDPDWPYRFDAAKATKVCRFIELLPHSKGKWAAQRELLRLEPWQCWFVCCAFGFIRKKDGLRRFRNVMLVVPRKAGKALALDTPVPTPTGWTTMGGLQVGDAVFAPDGSTRQVIAATEVMHDRPCFRMRLWDGEEIVADAEHLWLTSARNGPHKGRRGEYRGTVPQVRTTTEIASTLLCAPGEMNHRIAIPAPFAAPHADLPLDPYALGVWLGDGQSGMARITIGKQDAEAMLANFAAIGFVVTHARDDDYRLGDGRRDVTDAVRAAKPQAILRQMGLLHNKHIPPAYMRASIPQRMVLLQGLMDSDGHCTARGQCEFTSTNGALARDVESLLWGLGFKPLVAEGTAALYGRAIGPKWRISFYAFQDRPVFRLPRKAARQKQCPARPPRSTSRQIVSCEPTPSVPVRCIQVDHPDGMFVVSRSHLPTHNSQLAAGIGLYMLAADGEFGAEVYCGAGSEKQAWEVFRPAKAMAQATPALTNHFGIEVNASNLHISANGSRFEPIIGKPGDGASPSCAILDEAHEHDTPDLRDTMVTGMGAREQPMLLTITTAGDNLAGPCYDDVLTGRKMLQGSIADDERFYVEYSIDADTPWDSVEAIRMANPNLEVSVSEEFLLARQREAIRNTREQGRFKTKHLNLWVNARSAFFNMQSWAQCYRADLTMESLRGRRCYIGMDLASKQDIAAMQLLFPLDDGTYATFGRYYLPEEIIEEAGRDHYRAWHLDGELRLTEGNMIDHQSILDDLLELRGQFDVEEVVFDPAQANWMMGRLTDLRVPVYEFIQYARNYSEPMKLVAGLIDSGKLRHRDGPSAPMTWMMSNVVSRTNAKEEVFPAKEKPELKIDAPVALIMAMARAMTNASTKSVYEQRGVLTFG